MSRLPTAARAFSSTARYKLPQELRNQLTQSVESYSQLETPLRGKDGYPDNVIIGKKVTQATIGGKESDNNNKYITMVEEAIGSNIISEKAVSEKLATGNFEKLRADIEDLIKQKQDRASKSIVSSASSSTSSSSGASSSSSSNPNRLFSSKNRSYTLSDTTIQKIKELRGANWRGVSKEEVRDATVSAENLVSTGKITKEEMEKMVTDLSKDQTNPNQFKALTKSLWEKSGDKFKGKGFNDGRLWRITVIAALIVNSAFTDELFEEVDNGKLSEEDAEFILSVAEFLEENLIAENKNHAIGSYNNIIRSIANIMLNPETSENDRQALTTNYDKIAVALRASLGLMTEQEQKSAGYTKRDTLTASNVESFTFDNNCVVAIAKDPTRGNVAGYSVCNGNQVTVSQACDENGKSTENPEVKNKMLSALGFPSSKGVSMIGHEQVVDQVASRSS